MYKLLSHNDLDGVGCGIIAKLAFGDHIEVRYNSVSGLDRQVELFLEADDKDTFLFITDLSVSEENEKRLQSFYESGGKLELLDHHKTALHFNDYEWAHVKVEDAEGHLCSATQLLYDYLVDSGALTPTKAIAEFVELVRQYDTWEWEKNNNLKAQRLNALFFLISIKEFEQTMISRLRSHDHFDFNEFEQKLLNMEENNIERYISRKRKQVVQTELRGLFAGIVHAESYHSDMGNQLGKDYPHLDYIVILNMGARKVGFRTIHDHVDVSQVAAHYGGGGHAKASGCKLTNEAYEDFVKPAFGKETLHEDARQNEYNVRESKFGALYKDRKNNKYLIYPLNDTDWAMNKNTKRLERIFPSFQEAEKALKRKENAWLLKDEKFVGYLMEKIKKQNN